jgi:hypothetical protein
MPSFYHEPKTIDDVVNLTIGKIEELTGIEIIREELYDDIECCLIFRNKPVCNTSCKDSYNSQLRRSIVITNSGKHKPLMETCMCKSY